jgi:lysophospholipase L1-like esterase
VGASTIEEALPGRTVAGLERSFRVDWALVARTGATTLGTVRRLEGIPARPFDVAVTALGVNDLTSGRSVRAFVRDQASLVSLLERRFAVRRIYLSGLPPVSGFPSLPQPLRWYLGKQAKRFDRALADWARGRDGCAHVPLDPSLDPTHMARDGFHPGPKIYAWWGAAVAGFVHRDLAPQP